MLTQNALRAANQLVDDSPCMVCGKRMTMHITPAPTCIVVRFACHGSYQAFTLDDALLTERQFVEAIVGFAEQAFAEEARSPDLRELIAYNRGRFPEVQPC